MSADFKLSGTDVAMAVVGIQRNETKRKDVVEASWRLEQGAVRRKELVWGWLHYDVSTAES
jgi:hypothetical protein